jgi:hypothetical protein
VPSSDTATEPRSGSMAVFSGNAMVKRIVGRGSGGR